MKFRTYITVLSAAILTACSGDALSPASIPLDDLRADFAAPPVSARPLTWYHVMSGNMTAAGLTKDLEAMKSAGIGGTILFNVTQGIPIGPIKFNSEEHLALIKHMAAESERLGLSFGVHNCDGWTSSGGPWITPENSMKKVVYSQAQAKGGAVDMTLKMPDIVAGYFEDIATLAYRRLPGEAQDAANIPVLSSPQKDLDLGIAADGILGATSRLKASEETPGHIDITYDKPFTVRTVNLWFENGRGVKPELWVSEDGKTYTKHTNLTSRRPGKKVWGSDEVLKTPVTARYFRIRSVKPFDLKELKLSAVSSIGNAWGRTGAARTSYNELSPIGSAPAASIIDPQTVIDLTGSVNKTGRLVTELPDGDWTIMRFGQTSTGAINIPASEEGTGLEVDKFSRAAVKIHYDAYQTNVINAVREVAPNAHQYTEIDSYEVGAQNWTAGFAQKFEDKYGYSLIPYMPLFAGRFVGGADLSEQVLWDMRELSNELIVENYYGYFTRLANADGLKTYIEPYGFGPFNNLDAGGKADIPMGEFWSRNDNTVTHSAVSAGHIYDKNIISAEAFTAMPEFNWKMHPALIKTEGDKHFALGINQMVFHRFAHQANTHVKPGMTMNRWGSHIDRTQIWWDSAGKGWFDYLARGQHMLRQGLPKSDALLFVGDGSPVACPEKLKTDAVPAFLNFDCLNADVMQNSLSAGDGAFTLENGAAYSILILQDHDVMHAGSLAALEKLAEGGGLIVGTAPKTLAGKAPDAGAIADFNRRVSALWARDNVVMPQTVTSAGWEPYLAARGLRPDVQIEGRPDWLFAHREDGDRDIYFLYNPEDSRQTVTANFRVTGKNAQLWNPINGAAEWPQGVTEHSDHTGLTLTLDAKQSVFVVFDKALPREVSAPKDVASVRNVNGPWSVRFDAEYGLDDTIVFDGAIDWKDHADTRVNYYSGPAVYTKSVTLSPRDLEGDRDVILDLGEVAVAASVTVNGADAGVSWMPPHRVDITKAVKPGDNTLEIKVDNLWVNRLIGDAGLPDTDNFTPASWVPTTYMPKWYSDNRPPTLGQRVTFTTVDFYKNDDPLVPSGLIGPVRIEFR